MADNAPPPPVATLEDRLRLSGEGGSRRPLVIYAIIGAAILLIVLIIKRNAQNVTAPAATSQAPRTITINEPYIPTEAADETAPPGDADEGGPPKTTLPPVATKPPPVGGDPHGPPTKVPPKPKPKPGPPPVHHETSYTVVAGDTLAEIAARHGVSVDALYAANKRVIDSWAEAHGHQPPYQNWIFAGEILTIP